MLGKTLIVGHKGQLGHDMMALAAQRASSVDGVDLPEIDITDKSSVLREVGARGPQLIINCAAYTAVDACETNRDTAFAVNATGIANLAEAARSAGAMLVHISTDYVFDGAKPGPYLESDRPNPQSVYGRTKLAGELRLAEIGPRHAIFRIAWLYGRFGANFVKTIRKVAAEKAARGEPLSVVNDQIGSPTSTVEVCRQILTAVESGAEGLFHCTAEGHCSWYDFASVIVGEAGIGVEVVPCSTEQFPRPAKRPANSVLENARLKQLGLNRMKHWREAFSDFLTEERNAAHGAAGGV
jgi:dTDP-4-dehydrorhamnose reductase